MLEGQWGLEDRSEGHDLENVTIREETSGPFLFRDSGTPTQYCTGLKPARERGRSDVHESVRLTQNGADQFANGVNY